jgi:hypothetical protein
MQKRGADGAGAWPGMEWPVNGMEAGCEKGKTGGA